MLNYHKMSRKRFIAGRALITNFAKSFVWMVR